MAKSRPSRPNSRAARRAESPSTNTDKSLKNLPRPASPTSKTNPYNISATNSGIQKSKPKQKVRGQSTRTQKLRKAKGSEKADWFSGKLETKVEKSKESGKRIQRRRKEWGDINEGAEKEVVGNGGIYGALKDEGDSLEGGGKKRKGGETDVNMKEEEEWVDEDGDEVTGRPVVEEKVAKTGPDGTTVVKETVKTAVEPQQQEEDEVL